MVARPIPAAWFTDNTFTDKSHATPTAQTAKPIASVENVTSCLIGRGRPIRNWRSVNARPLLFLISLNLSPLRQVQIHYLMINVSSASNIGENLLYLGPLSHSRY